MGFLKISFIFMTAIHIGLHISSSAVMREPYVLISNFTVNVVMSFCLLFSVTAISSSVHICYVRERNRTSGGHSPQELDGPLDCKAI